MEGKDKQGKKAELLNPLNIMGGLMVTVCTLDYFHAPLRILTMKYLIGVFLVLNCGEALKQVER